MKKPLLLMAAGGTGGHMFPAQALAEYMINMGWRVKLSTDQRGARYVQGFPDDVMIDVVSSATFSRPGLGAKLKAPFKIFGGVIKAMLHMLFDRPTVVIGFGGYPSIPALAAAKLLKRPTIIHEQNGVLGRVNEIFAKRVNRVACGTWPTKLPDGVTGVEVGNPVRAAVLKRHGAGYIPPGDYPMQILVMGGSQGAHILSQNVPAAVGLIPLEIRKHLRVVHQAREEDVDNVIADYAQRGIRAEVSPFFENIASLISESQLVISRSGASSIADISVIGRPAIFIPLAAAVRDEQTANAEELFDAGAAEIMPESEATPANLAVEMADILSNPDAANAMAVAALSCARPEATETLGDLVQELADKKS